MTKRHRPTSEEKKLIRDCCKLNAGLKSLRIEPTYRCRLDGKDQWPDGERDLNFAFLLSADRKSDETDLADNTDWRAFCRGFRFTDDGCAVIEFAIYSLGYYGELESHVKAWWRDGVLDEIDGCLDGVMWHRGAEKIGKHLKRSKTHAV